MCYGFKLEFDQEEDILNVWAAGGIGSTPDHKGDLLFYLPGSEAIKSFRDYCDTCLAEIEARKTK